jgi:hypothetical protein
MKDIRWLTSSLSVIMAGPVSLFIPGLPDGAYSASELGVDALGHTTWQVVPASDASNQFQAFDTGELTFCHESMDPIPDYLMAPCRQQLWSRAPIIYP